jgi:hypothetical protein
LVNDRRDLYARAAVLLLALGVLTTVAWSRGAEYDEQYTLFVTSGTPRPIWPEAVFPAHEVVRVQSGHAGLAEIARDLRRTDVHPPLYFWAAALWRPLAGDGLFAVRLLSVFFGLGALIAVGMAARRCDIPPATAMLLMLGCYGFAYTAAIARGFALAQMFTLVGLVAILSGRRFLAGLLLGAAVATNYLAVFACVAVAAIGLRSRWRIAIGVLPGLVGAVWFFLAQRGTRTGQFPPFELLPSLIRLGRYGAANLTGGLPLYAPETAQSLIAAGLALALLVVAGMVALRWRNFGMSHFYLALAALAPPVGLLALGCVFDNTPIELRYLSFSTPFIGLLVAAARPSRLVLAAILTVQAASLAGLIMRPETMQPATATALAAAELAGEGAVMLPLGNDGVGIVGAFAAASPPGMRLSIVGPDETLEDIRRRIAPLRRIVLAEMSQDGDSRRALLVMRVALRDPGWREIGRGFHVVAYERLDRPEP